MWSSQCAFQGGRSSLSGQQLAGILLKHLSVIISGAPAVFFPKQRGDKEGQWRAWISFNSQLTSCYLFLVMILRGRGEVTTWCVTQDPHRWLFQPSCSGRIETIMSLNGSPSRISRLRQYKNRLLHPWKHLVTFVTFLFFPPQDIQDWKRVSPERTKCVEPGWKQNLDHWWPAGSRLFDWTQLARQQHHFASK